MIMNLNQLTKKEIKAFARDLASFNTLAWDFVCEAEKMALNPISRYSTHFGNEEFLKKLASEYQKLDKNDEDFIDITTNIAYFQTMDSLKDRLNEVLENPNE